MKWNKSSILRKGLSNMAEEQSPLKGLLSGLTRDQLQALVLKLVEQKPSLTESVQVQATLLQSPSPQPSAAPKPKTHVDPQWVRRQVRASIHSLDRMRSSEAYW